MATNITLAPPQTNFLSDPMFIEIETDRKNAAPGGGFTFNEVNLSCYMQIEVYFDNEWGVGVVPNHFLTELEPNYNNADGKCTVDLKNLIPLSITPPPDESIPPQISAIPFSFKSGLLGKSSGAIIVKFADQFGNPKIVENSLNVSPPYKVVYGSSRFWQGFSTLHNRNLILLNSFRSFERNINNIIVKEIFLNQPEYLSFYSRVDTTLNLFANVTLEDGTMVPDVALTANPITIKKGCNYVGVSLSQTRITYLHPTAKKYTLKFTSPDQSVQNMPQVQYSIMKHETMNLMYLLFDTGIGGVETLPIYGRIKKSNEVQSAQNEKQAWKGTNFRDGVISSSFRNGKQVIECNSGYNTPDYIEHISQILYSEFVWLIDTARRKFIRVQVTSSEADIKDSASDLHNLKFTIKDAFRSYSHNSFNL